MNEKFDYKEVPDGYLHCLNAQCVKSSDCLRFKAGTHVSNEVKYFLIINAANANEQKECSYFQPDRLVRCALGITHLYDNLPHTKYTKIKKAIHDHFGHSHYYRIYNKKYFIKPEDQVFIRELFVKEGIESEPLFDEYIERYDFFPTRK